MHIVLRMLRCTELGLLLFYSLLVSGGRVFVSSGEEVTLRTTTILLYYLYNGPLKC